MKPLPLVLSLPDLAEVLHFAPEISMVTTTTMSTPRKAGDGDA